MKRIKKLIILFIIGIIILESCVTVVNRPKPRDKRPVKKIIIVKPKKP